MNPEVFAEWFRQRGLKVVQTSSSYWVEAERRAMQAFPYHWLICPDEKELSSLFVSEGALVLRYSTLPELQKGHPSYHAVYDLPSYGFENLGQWARKNVRHGLRSCSVETLTFQRLAEEGYALQLDTLDRQKRRVKFDLSAWRKMCLSAEGLPGFQAWGALVDGKLAASVITFLMDDCAYMLYQQCLSPHMSLHVNNALSFIVTRTLIGQPGVHSILYGLHSLDAPPRVDQFKFRMGYSARSVRQCVVFHPWVRPIAGRLTHRVVDGLHRLHPANPQLAKAEGLLRFYLET